MADRDRLLERIIKVLERVNTAAANIVTSVFTGTSGTVGQNNGSVPDDGTPSSGRYLKDDGTWDNPGAAGTVKVPCCNFGAKSDNVGKHLIANGCADKADDFTKTKTRHTIPFTGTLKNLVYLTKEADTTTQMKIHINGVVAATVLLANVQANFGGIEPLSILVTAGDEIEIEYDAGQKPAECTMYFIIQPT